MDIKKIKIITSFLILSILIDKLELMNSNQLNAKVLNSSNSHIKNNRQQKKQNVYHGPKIVLYGAHKTSVNMIENLIKNNISGSFDQRNINKLLLLMYETNLFEDIKIDLLGNILSVEVVENKIIRKFELKGDKDLKDKQLKDLIEMIPGQVLNNHELNSTIKKIQQFYSDIGYFNVRVEKKIIPVSAQFVDLEIEIIKGKAPKIAEIIFVGNQNINSDKLIEQGVFRQKSLLKILSKRTNYNKELLKLNQDNLEKFYHYYGYLNFKILSTEVIFDPRSNEIKLIFEVDEGKQFRIKQVETKTDFILPQEVKKIIAQSKEQIFNKTKFESDIKIIKRLLKKNGINADVLFSYENLDENGNIKLVFEIVKAKNYFVRNISIQGNTRTKDSVIRNQITVHEGDLFSFDSVESSYRRIYNLGFFEQVIPDYKLDENGMVDLIFDVQEKKTGEIHFGLSYSSANGAFGEVSIHENNFMGTGNIVGLGIQKGNNHISLSGSYYQNNIFDTILGGGISAFYDDHREDKLNYSIKSYGGTINTSIPLSPDFSIKLRYLLQFDKIYDVRENASQTVKEQKPKTTSSAIMYQLVYDKRNIIDYPTEGYYLNFSQDFAGLGGDKFYVSSELTTRFYKTLFNWGQIKSSKNSVVLQLKNNFGIVRPYKDYILRINDRFFLTDFRGFRQISGVSPRDDHHKAIGGDKYFFGTAQIEAPINLIQDFDLKGHVFVDYGKLLAKQENLFSSKDIANGKAKILNEEKLRVAVGVGVTMVTPFAPISLAVGVPLRYDQDLDKKKYFYLSMGKKF